MSYRFAEMVVALCLGLAFALVGWWEIAGPAWREASSGSAREWLEVASATLLGCAILIGGAGALYEMLRRS
jgi:membrane protein required for beta-lactamase induction